MSAYESSIPPVSIDGKFGADTERAVRAYQQFAGLTVDGVVGRTTWNSLYGRASQLRSSGPVVTLKRLPYPGTPLTVGSSGKAVLYYNLLLLRIAYYFFQCGSPAPCRPLYRRNCHSHPQRPAAFGGWSRPALPMPTHGRRWKR